MEVVEFEVEFDKFCKDCIHYQDAEVADPCNECLGRPSNEHSHKPVYFKKDE